MSTLANRISEIQKGDIAKFQTCAHMLVVCNFFIYQKNAMEVKNIEDNLEILCFEGYDKYWKVLTKNICRCQA